MTSVYYLGIGKRKTAIATVMLREGTGELNVNGKSFGNYFSGTFNEEKALTQLLNFLPMPSDYDIFGRVSGGGITAQLEALRLAVARALCKLDQNYRKELGKRLFLRRDSRIKERKKYGLRKARKAPQYSKR